jgi:hypothetical protein
MMTQLKKRKMDKEKVLEVINGIIVDRLTQLIEDMSNHDFIEFVMDRLEQEGVVIDTENDDVVEKIRDVVGTRVLPLLLKVCEWGIGKEIPTE